VSIFGKGEGETENGGCKSLSFPPSLSISLCVAQCVCVEHSVAHRCPVEENEQSVLVKAEAKLKGKGDEKKSLAHKEFHHRLSVVTQREKEREREERESSVESAEDLI
jgi:hypothetical protein